MNRRSREEIGEVLDTTEESSNPEPRSLGGDLPLSRRCHRGQHARCPGEWTAYPDQHGPCECSCHGLVTEGGA